MPNNHIKCPNCGTEFDVQNVLSADLEQKLRQEFEKQFQQSLSQVNADKKKLEEEQKQFEEKRIRKMNFFSKSCNRKNKKWNWSCSNSFAKALPQILKMN